jgi:choline dehydrogenase-like flavoprotein
MKYDIIIVGGGLGGATLAKNLAEHGLAALVLERETVFRNRVRGEQMHPWGVAEARTLGVYDDLLRNCGQQTRWWGQSPMNVALGSFRLFWSTRLGFPIFSGSGQLRHPLTIRRGDCFAPSAKLRAATNIARPLKTVEPSSYHVGVVASRVTHLSSLLLP